MPKLKLGVLISGRGSNLQALIDACRDSDFPAEISLVISNRPGAFGLERAQNADIPVEVIDHKTFETRSAFDQAVSRRLEEANVDLICLAGFMLLLNNEFVTRWHNKLINIHPSLLPAFKGLHIHDRVHAAGVKVTGCTVHYVRAEVDDGPIIIQAAVPVLETDTPESIGARVLEAEHKIYPEAVRLIANGQADLKGEKVVVNTSGEPPATLINPSIGE